MSKKAEAALKAYPFIPLIQYDLRDENPTDGNKIHRRIFLEGYEQAEKDLALTWEDVAILITIYEQEVEAGNISRYEGEGVPSLQDASEIILRRFNEIRKK